MMTPAEIKNLLETALSETRVEITGDGHHFNAVVISSVFEGKSRIERQRLVYEVLNPWIADGRLHAISMKTMTPVEFAATIP